MIFPEMNEWSYPDMRAKEAEGDNTGARDQQYKIQREESIS